MNHTEILTRLRAEIEAPPQLRLVRVQWVRFQSDRHLIGLKVAILVLLVVLASLI